MGHSNTTAPQKDTEAPSADNRGRGLPPIDVYCSECDRDPGFRCRRQHELPDGFHAARIARARGKLLPPRREWEVSPKRRRRVPSREHSTASRINGPAVHLPLSPSDPH